MDALECRSCKEAELHHKPESGGEDNGEGGPRHRGAEALPHDLDEDDKDVESEHQQKTIRDKDAGEAGRDDEDVLEVEGWEKRGGTEDDEKEDELEDREDDFLHEWALEMSLARPLENAAVVSQLRLFREGWTRRGRSDAPVATALRPFRWTAGS